MPTRKVRSIAYTVEKFLPAVAAIGGEKRRMQRLLADLLDQVATEHKGEVIAKVVFKGLNDRTHD